MTSPEPSPLTVAAYVLTVGVLLALMTSLPVTFLIV